MQTRDRKIAVNRAFERCKTDCVKQASETESSVSAMDNQAGQFSLHDALSQNLMVAPLFHTEETVQDDEMSGDVTTFEIRSN